MKRGKYLVMGLMFFIVTLIVPSISSNLSNLINNKSLKTFLDLDGFGKAYAVSQWARKYKTPCSTCHTVIPRLNFYGERFMRNGFQDPDNDMPDGGTLRKKQHEGVDLGLLGDYLGARISIQPLFIQDDGLSRNGGTETRVDVGKFNWIQFFTAGTIAKNVSFFNELEINAKGIVKQGWFILGLHNLVGAPGLVNFQIGKISPVEWTSFSNRLRILSEIKGFGDKVASSNGAGEDSVNISSSQFGINYYGYQGPFVWSGGIGNGANATDINQDKNFWGSLRMEVPEGDSPFEGSSVSIFYYDGVDTAMTSTAQRKNNFWRLQPSANLRWKNFDIIGSFIYGREDNFSLSAPAVSERFWGATGIFSYFFDPSYQVGIQYDTVEARNSVAIEQERVAFHFGFLPRENINIIFTADLRVEGSTDHQYFTTIRSMF